MNRLFLNDNTLPVIDGKVQLCEICPCGWGVFTGRKYQVAPGYSNVEYRFTFQDNGLNFFTAAQPSRVYQYALQEAWQIESATRGDFASTNALIPSGVVFSDDGKHLVVGDGYYGRIRSGELETAWDVTTLAMKSLISLSYDPGDLFLTADGKTMFVVYNQAEIYRYKLSTAWDVSTAEIEYSHNLNDEIKGIFFSADGRKLYVLLGEIRKQVWQYYLPTAWDARTAVYETHSVTLIDKTVDFYIDQSGTRMFLLGENSGDGHWLYEYSIPAWPGVDHGRAEETFSASSLSMLRTAAAASPSTACCYAEDTGKRAFPAAPCRGNRIICHKIEGHTSYTKACTPEKCKFYEEG